MFLPDSVHENVYSSKRCRAVRKRIDLHDTAGLLFSLSRFCQRVDQHVCELLCSQGACGDSDDGRFTVAKHVSLKAKVLDPT